MRTRLFSGAALLALAMFVAWHWTTKPTQTAHRFHRLLEQGKVSEAGEMMAHAAALKITKTEHGDRDDAWIEVSLGSASRVCLVDDLGTEIFFEPRSFEDILLGRGRVTPLLDRYVALSGAT